MLRLGGAEVKLVYLEFLEMDMRPLGGLALGRSLSRGNNLSLLTLKIEFSPEFGAAGTFLIFSEYVVYRILFVITTYVCVNYRLFKSMSRIKN